MLSWSRTANYFFFGLCLLLGALPMAQARQDVRSFTGRVVAVAAGDAIDVRKADGSTVSVRLHGIECPTAPRALRETATRYTSRLILDTGVRVTPFGRESRTVVYGEVYPPSGNISVNNTLVRVGMARWTSAYAASRDDLHRAEDAAKAEKSGLWGASDGSNVTLPRSKASSAPPPNVSRMPSPVPTAAVPSPSPHYPTGIPLAFGAALAFVGTMVGLFTYAATQRLPWTGRRLSAQLILALLAAGLGTLMFSVALPGSSAGSILTTLLGIFLPIPAALLLRFGIQKTKRALRLRGHPVDPRYADLGFVKVQGLAENQDGERVYSSVGDIQGLYVRECIERYTAETGTGKRLKSARWVTVSDEATAVDFTLTTALGDGTGAARVLTELNDDMPDSGVRWLPYHVARFYNDIPTDAWFPNPYEGDTRTEVFVVPNGATLTVWGNLYPPAFHEPAEKGELPMCRIAPDGTEASLIITDGAESRAYTGPGAPSQAFGFVALLLGIVALAGTVYAFVIGGFAVQRLTLTMIGIALAIILALALRRAAVLAQNQRTEAARNYSDPLRRPAMATWEQYQRRFPGSIIAHAFGD